MRIWSLSLTGWPMDLSPSQIITWWLKWWIMRATGLRKILCFSMRAAWTSWYHTQVTSILHISRIPELPSTSFMISWGNLSLHISCARKETTHRTSIRVYFTKMLMEYSLTPPMYFKSQIWRARRPFHAQTNTFSLNKHHHPSRWH